MPIGFITPSEGQAAHGRWREMFFGQGRFETPAAAARNCGFQQQQAVGFGASYPCLPAEGLSRNRIERRWHGDWRHRFVFGRGMCSDDTEHTFFVAQALLSHPNDPVEFQRSLAWKLRLWLLGLPAGVGLATLRAVLKLWLGFPASRSGVWSCDEERDSWPTGSAGLVHLINPGATRSRERQ